MVLGFVGVAVGGGKYRAGWVCDIVRIDLLGIYICGCGECCGFA